MKTTALRLMTLLLVLTFLVSACAKATNVTPGAFPVEAKPTATQGMPTAAPPEEKIELTVWYWGDPDAPGADKWLAETADKYMAMKPNLKITIVTQDGSTLFSALQTAASSNSGPDIASQWATGPVLSFVWSNALVPVSDFVPADELKHWLNLNENTYNGKVWGASLYIVGVYFIYNKDMFQTAGVTPPGPNERWSWDQFMAACEKLKASGVVPFALGDSDGYGGAWFFSTLGMQGLDSTDELRQAVIGKASFKDAKYTGFYKLLDDMVKKGYLNSDVMSIQHAQAFVRVSQGTAAMQWGIDGVIKQTLKDMDPAKVGVMRVPKWGTGKMADYGDATQSTSYLITKWSKHPQEAADFIAFWHSQERLNAWYAATGVVPADDRFDINLVTDPVMKQVITWNITGTQVWLENWVPGQVDGDGDLPAGQLIFSQGGTPDAAADIWERAADSWRKQNPKELENWTNWQQ